MYILLFFFFKQKTAYEMRISDWSSDVCSSDLGIPQAARYSPCSLRTSSATVGMSSIRPTPCPPPQTSRHGVLPSGNSLTPGGGGRFSGSRPIRPKDPLSPLAGLPFPVDVKMTDRQCVVKGKRVSIRLDLVGS